MLDAAVTACPGFASLFQPPNCFTIRGKISKIIQDRACGFIRPAEGVEVLFDYTDLAGLDFLRFQEGDEVEFDVEMGPRGRRAVNVRRSESQAD